MWDALRAIPLRRGVEAAAVGAVGVVGPARQGARQAVLLRRGVAPAAVGARPLVGPLGQAALPAVLGRRLAVARQRLLLQLPVARQK